MTSDQSKEAFSLACELFIADSVLHNATNVSISEYRDYMSLSFESIRCQDLSLVATDTQNNEIVGCIVACDYSIQGPEKMSIPERIKPVNALLNSLEIMYQKDRQLHSGQCMLVDMAVVKPAARNQGIYSQLRKAVHRIGREAGFCFVVGELSSAATQHLCINQFKHKICAEINYSSYQFKGQYPFSTIKTPKSIVLVEGEL